MGKRGPAPKLAVLKRLEGNPGKRPIKDSGITGRGSFFVPDHLSDEAHACLEVIRRSMPNEVYCKLDSYLLAAFATAWGIHRRAAMQVDRPDFDWITEGGKRSPWLQVLNEQVKIMVVLSDHLGLDPKARAALHTPSEKPVSKFAGLIEQQTSSASLSC